MSILALVWPRTLMHSQPLSKSLNSSPTLELPCALINSHALSKFELSSTLVLVWPRTLMHSHRLSCALFDSRSLSKSSNSRPLSPSFGLKLSCALKEFQLSSTLALVWPPTLMWSRQLSRVLKEFELSISFWPGLKNQKRFETSMYEVFGGKRYLFPRRKPPFWL